MRLEGERHGHTCGLPRPRHCAADDRLVAQVRAVEVAEREDAAGEPLGPAREVVDVAHRHNLYLVLHAGLGFGVAHGTELASGFGIVGRSVATHSLKVL